MLVQFGTAMRWDPVSESQHERMERLDTKVERLILRAL